MRTDPLYPALRQMSLEERQMALCLIVKMLKKSNFQSGGVLDALRRLSQPQRRKSA